jgi:hypothetical protein
LKKRFTDYPYENHEIEKSVPRRMPKVVGKDYIGMAKAYPMSKRVGDVNISNEDASLGGNEVPTMTPNMRRTAAGTTMHSTITREARTGLRNERDYMSDSPVDSANSTAYRNYAKFTNHRRPEEVDLDDSLNDRFISPEKAYEEESKYKTPSSLNRFKIQVFFINLLIDQERGVT